MLKSIMTTLVVLVAFNVCANVYDYTIEPVYQSSIQQLGPNVTNEDIAGGKMHQWLKSEVYFWGNILILVGGLGLIMKSGYKQIMSMVLLAVMFSGGCAYKPFPPVKLETIQPYEEAFLIPLTENVEKQQSSHTEEFLEKNLVYSQQVQIPQQWVQLGYNYGGYNGEWRDGAVLIKVDRSPVSREWTADPNTGTSNKNEAVWVMTSDQVEFSTGWTITARIATRNDAIKFLAAYPNGQLHDVLDREVRGKLQASFGIEVTDLPMDELRRHATPHIKAVVDDVTKYCKDRGIEIVNLGITGGFIYKDESIKSQLVKLFNSEQDKEIAKQKAEALLTEKGAEAKGIQLVADAKFYEIEKAKQDMESYVGLKRIELLKAQLEKWDGKFPSYFMSSGGQTPQMLLQLPEGK